MTYKIRKIQSLFHKDYRCEYKRVFLLNENGQQFTVSVIPRLKSSDHWKPFLEEGIIIHKVSLMPGDPNSIDPNSEPEIASPEDNMEQLSLL